MQPRRRASPSPALLAILATGSAPAAELPAQQISANLLATIDFRSIGPTRQSGRFVDIAVHEQEPWTFYMATASGHLWKTINNGVTFEPVFTDEAVFSIGDLAVAPSDPDILYLGSGEANNSRSSYWGDGVYKSTDAGTTWTNVGLPESHHIGRVLVHPTDADVVYVAALGHLYSENEERGLYKTSDGGVTWRKVLGPIVAGKHIGVGVVDVAIDPTNPEVLYAATYDKVRLPFTYDLGGPGSRVSKSLDGGESWVMLEGGLPMGMLGRIGIGLYARDPDIVYLTIENANKEGMTDEARLEELRAHRSSRGMVGGEVYRSDNAGSTWRKVSPDTMSIGGAPAYYYGQIVVDPSDPDVVHVLSATSWGTRDGGATWVRQPLGFGGDDHALWIDPEDSRHAILAYDHGMGITYDGGQNWHHPDNQSLAQFYAVDVDMSRPYRVAGGTQDNGSHVAYHTNPAGGPVYLEMWERVGSGDGMHIVFDDCDNRYLYSESQFGNISRLDLWTGARDSIRHDDELRWNWNAPVLVSPHDCEVVFHAANKLLRSSNRGETWEVLSPDLTRADSANLTTGKGGDGNIQYATITSFDESPLVEGLLWVGTDDGNVQLSRDGGETWTLLNERVPDNPGYWVSRVQASHHDPGTAYVSFTGYRRDDFRPFLYRATNYGESWTSIASNLPDQPINVVREHHHNPSLLFVGTEFGVYVTIDGGGHWVELASGIPTTPVHDMQIHPRDNDLVVATHGRGIYVAEIAPLTELTADVLSQDDFLFQPESRIRWIGSDRTHHAAANFPGESEPDEMRLFYYLRDDQQEDVTLSVYLGNLFVAEVRGPGTAGLHEVGWDMTRRTERGREEMRRARDRAELAGGGLNEDEVRFAYEAAPYGEYRIVLTTAGSEAHRSASILRDEWWTERR